VYKRHDHEKDHPWEDTPFGVTGLEWAAAVVNTIVGLAPDRLFEVMAAVPAAIAGITGQGVLEVGGPANLVVFDPDAASDTGRTISRSSNAPYLGMELRGAVVHTVYEGRFTVKDGTIVEPAEVPG
jgi:dihydroorotase